MNRTWHLDDSREIEIVTEFDLEMEKLRIPVKTPGGGAGSDTVVIAISAKNRAEGRLSVLALLGRAAASGSGGLVFGERVEPPRATATEIATATGERLTERAMITPTDPTGEKTSLHCATAKKEEEK